MRKSDVIFYLLISTAVTYFSLFYFLGKNLEFWIKDIFACYEKMDFSVFLKDHLHIFLYLFMFFGLTFFFSKFLLSLWKNILYYLNMKKIVEKLLLKKYKNILILDSSELIAFNFGLFKRYIVLSKGVLNLKRQEKKHIFSHEKTHFLGNDSFKFFVVSVITYLFLNGKKLEKIYKLIREVEVDLAVEKNRYAYLNTLLRFLERKPYVSMPMANLYLGERFNFILEEKEPQMPKYIFLLPLITLAVFVLVTLYKMCFCGVML